MTLKTEWKKIPVAGGSMDVHVTTPEGRINGGIVMLQEIFGVNAAMQAKATKFAAAGFVVALPDLFWRLEPLVNLGYSEEERKKGFGLLQKFDFPKGVADVIATGNWLNDQSGCNGRVGTLGFCIGGKIAVIAGAQAPFKSAVAFYGVKLDDNIALLESYPVPIQIHVGDQDTHIPAETTQKVDAAVKKSGRGDVFVYPGAQHGFFNAVRSESYDAGAASKAEERAVTFLKKVLA
jgi:carboxymethylenebutenolidase